MTTSSTTAETIENITVSDEAQSYLTLQATIKSGYEGLKSDPSFRNRTAQRQMIGLLAKAFFQASDEHRPMAVVEAGTGTGKTFGYCLPLIPMAKYHQKTLLIATGTIALQEQLVQHDLPQLKQLTGWDFSFALAKGRRRYVCPARLTALGQSTGTPLASLFESFDQAEKKTESTSALLPSAQSLSKALDDGWDGDFDRLPYTLDDQLQQAVTTDSAGCTNRRCAHFDACPYLKAKAQLMSCDVVVTNHAMLISDLKIGGGAVLPAPNACFHIIDEGHRLPAEVLAHNASGHLLHGAQAWLESLIKFSQGLLALGDDIYRQLVGRYPLELTQIAQGVKDRLQQLYAQLAQQGDFHPDLTKADLNALSKEAFTTRFEHGRLPDWLRIAGQEIHDTATALLTNLSKLYDLSSDAHQREPHDALTKQLIDLGFFKDRTQNLLSTWTLLLDSREVLPHAKWIEYRQKGDTIDFMISASPTEAKSFLQSQLWEKSSGSAITSATLTALGAFDYFFNQCGIEPQQAVYAQFLSPFDYQKATLHIPDLVEPSYPEHTQAIIDWAIANLNPNEATLMLFTSQAQMNRVAIALGERFCIQLQGQHAKHQLISAHKACIDAGKGSVLMGLDSFGEGLNLPGDYCRHLVIAKLPFPVPSSPVEQAQSEYLETIGKRPFNEISLPLTSAKLTQWVGRLIRTEEDTGRVSILDIRLLKKRYGQQMLANLPPFRRV